MYLHSSGYSIHQKIPFSVYGENLIILAQNLIIVLLFWAYSKDIGLVEKLLIIGMLVTYYFVLFTDGYLNHDQWEMVAQTNIFFCKLNDV